MKRIYFNHISSWKNGILVISSILCSLIGTFELFSEANMVWNKRMMALGSILVFLFFAKMTFGKYYIGWNKVGITIRIKSLLRKSFNFRDVKSTDLENGILTVVKKNGKKIKIDLSEIEKTDIEKLNDIIIENTVINNI